MLFTGLTIFSSLEAIEARSWHFNLSSILDMARSPMMQLALLVLSLRIVGQPLADILALQMKFARTLRCRQGLQLSLGQSSQGTSNTGFSPAAQAKA